MLAQTTPCTEPPRVLVLLSHQRSGSTQLTKALAQSLPCVVDGGEPLLVDASASGYQRLQDWRRLNHTLATRRRRHALAWLLHVREHLCGVVAIAPACRAQCTMVAKVFPTHHAHLSGLKELARHPSVVSVALERDAPSVECSVRWARLTQDWSNDPWERARAGRAAEYRHFVASRCVPTAAFAKAHAAWYRMAHEMRAARVAFENASAQPIATVASLGRLLCKTAVARAESAPASQHRPMTSATLAIVTVVMRRADLTLPRWMKHHANLRIDEVVLYDYPHTRGATRRAVAAAPQTMTVRRFAANGSGSLWSLAWRSCVKCCGDAATPPHVRSRALVRSAARPDMCERRIYMPEQAHAMRHALGVVRAGWLVQLDLDEFLVGNGGPPGRTWQPYLRTLAARARPPGGIKVLQLQMIDRATFLEPWPRAWSERKCLIRRAAAHPDENAFGSIHEVTLASGEEYVYAPHGLLAIAHFRYADWGRGNNASAVARARMADLGCFSRASRGDVCLAKRNEVWRWDAQRRTRGRRPMRVQRMVLG